MNDNRNRYVIAAALVWAAIWLATGLVAGHAFDDLILILGGGTMFFIVLVPAMFFRKPTDGGAK